MPNISFVKKLITCTLAGLVIILDLPYSSISPPDLFWTFFSHSYLFACIIAGLEIVGAMLLLFRRTRLAGVFVLLPVLGNIMMMDIFYDVGDLVRFGRSADIGGKDREGYGGGSTAESPDG